MENNNITEYEECIVCGDNKQCTSSFLSLPFCSECSIHLYNDDINLTKSMKENTIIWNNDENEIGNDETEILRKVEEHLKLCRDKIDLSLEKIKNYSGDMDESDIRKATVHLQSAFYLVSRKNVYTK